MNTLERPMSYEQASSRRDHLTLTTKEGKIELMEEQLDRVTGGAAVDNKRMPWPPQPLKIG
jgi:hypothetical protein